MAGRNTEIRVGIAVIGALALVIWGVTWLSDARLARKRRVYNVRFSDVGGLATGDPVSVNGVSLGKVLDISLRPGGVNVKFAIDRGVRVTRSSSVNVRNTGLMGEKFIAVDLAEDGPVYGERDTILGYYETGVPEVISQMGDALHSLQRVSDQVDRLLALAEERGTLRKTLHNVEGASVDLQGTIAENRDDLRQTAQNLREVSSQLRTLVEQKNPIVTRTVDRLDATSGRADTLITHLDAAAARFASLAEKADSDSSTFGMLLRDRQLYDQMHGSVRELNDLVRDIKENPHRYLKFSLF
ncbi:MAG TPA: MlaD family protein [Candidatus Eisenbacteria bacterium]|jgi:phospholipid/cholesterol/gamma-HCH transport system substrate-binding protein|nr:MlaD family protein [Candidatus Eisenbacteria bacterium]